MLSSLNKIKFIVLAFVFFIFLIQYSASSTLENEELVISFLKYWSIFSNLIFSLGKVDAAVGKNAN